MKKIITTIIISISLFTSTFLANADNWKIVELFDIYKWVEEYSLGLIEIEPVSFSNSDLQRTYDEFLIVDKELKTAFISQYRAWDISYYQMQDLITAYNNFVFYSGKTFSYISEKQNWLVSQELDNALKNSYTNMRSSYLKVFHIMSK